MFRSWVFKEDKNSELDGFKTLKELHAGDILYVDKIGNVDENTNALGVFLIVDSKLVLLSPLSSENSKVFLPYIDHGDKIQGRIYAIQNKKNGEIILSLIFDNIEEIPPEPIKSEKILLQEISNTLKDQARDLHTIKSIMILLIVIAAVGIFFSIFGSLLIR